MLLLSRGNSEVTVTDTTSKRCHVGLEDQYDKKNTCNIHVIHRSNGTVFTRYFIV